MPLTNFGSILNFAEELEKTDQAFYDAVSQNPNCSEYKEIFEQFAADAKKNIKTVLRTRRENVTEMILEPIKDFTRAPFQEKYVGADKMSAQDAIDTARRLEQRTERYYLEASEKIKALSEVSRALKLIAKKHTAHLKKLESV
jgi:rubrerythrin